jgi:hypothetical protein
MHSVSVRRGDARIDRLDESAVRTTDREPNLDAQLYYGRQTAILFVQDLRIGDVLECEYTIRGRDPTMAGHTASVFVLGLNEPVDRVHARLVA